MKIIVDSEGNRKIDFQGARLPDGRSIDDVLNENELLKKELIDVQREIKDKSSIISSLIPWKWIRDVIEIILLIFGIIGIIVLFV